MNWKWIYSAEYNCFNLMDDDKMLAFITVRPTYCDRGHYLACIEIGCGLTPEDFRPNYYMHLETAKAETVEFLMWRLHKKRAESFFTDGESFRTMQA